ncbi:MAG: MFS transporter [Caldilineaceae bacterium]|nr:MFS transporter [Caldilineaceae bacterium]
MIPQWRRNLYVLFGVQLLTTAGFSLVFPFLPLYIKEIGVATHGSLEFWSGLVFSSQALTMMIASPIWGVVADRHGRKPMLLRATVGGAILLTLMGFAQNAEQLVLLRTIQGAVTGVISAVNALVAATAPKEKMGSSLGLLMFARWGGIALGPVIGGVLGDAFGFRESFWITGALLGLAGLGVWLWVYEEFTPVEKAKRPSLVGSYQMLLAAPGMMGLYSLAFLRSLGQMMIYPVAALFMIELMGTESGAATASGLMIGAVAGTSAVSSVYLGQLGDRIGHERILITSALVALLCYLPQPFVTAPWQLISLQGLAGFAMGGLLSPMAALMNLWTPPNTQGATYALDNSVAAAGRSISPMVAAGVATWIGIRGVFGLTALVYGIIAVQVFWLAHQMRQRRLAQEQATQLVTGD